MSFNSIQNVLHFRRFLHFSCGQTSQNTKFYIKITKYTFYKGAREVGKGLQMNIETALFTSLQACKEWPSDVIGTQNTNKEASIVLSVKLNGPLNY